MAGSDSELFPVKGVNGKGTTYEDFRYIMLRHTLMRYSRVHAVACLLNHVYPNHTYDDQ